MPTVAVINVRRRARSVYAVAGARPSRIKGGAGLAAPARERTVRR
jgi:hypothetical protein